MDGVTASLEGLNLGQVPVYLLKTKSSPSDSYEEHFTTLSDGHYKPLFIPVLEHQFRDDTLRKLRLSAERFAFAGGRYVQNVSKSIGTDPHPLHSTTTSHDDQTKSPTYIIHR